jgi:Tfp pilus assembly protein PilX
MPTPTPTVDPTMVSPGPEGFTVIAILVVLVALLVIDMLRRVRRTRYRAEANEALDAEEAAARGETTQDPDGAAPADGAEGDEPAGGDGARR